MRPKLNLIFKQIEELDPPAELAGLILSQIKRENSQLFRVELLLTRLGFAGSLFILAYTLWFFGQSILNSDFWKLTSLVGSDLNAVAGNWQEFGYSLLETLPVSSLVAILLPLFTLFLCFNLYLTLNDKNHGHSKIKAI